MSTLKVSSVRNILSPVYRSGEDNEFLDCAVVWRGIQVLVGMHWLPGDSVV
jgi:hypothetical protein